MDISAYTWRNADPRSKFTAGKGQHNVVESMLDQNQIRRHRVLALANERELLGKHDRNVICLSVTAATCIQSKASGLRSQTNWGSGSRLTLK